MKCELCKHEVVEQAVLCESCTEAIQRLVVISRRNLDQDVPLSARANAAA